jgi:hypothetical protein
MRALSLARSLAISLSLARARSLSHTHTGPAARNGQIQEGDILQQVLAACVCVSACVCLYVASVRVLLFFWEKIPSVFLFFIQYFFYIQHFFCLKKIHISTWCDLVEHPQVDKTVVSTFKLKDLASHLLGPEGTQVELVMLRKGSR